MVGNLLNIDAAQAACLVKTKETPGPRKTAEIII